MNLPKSIFIRELGPREGFQTLSKVVPTEQKIELIEALSLTGVKFIEVTSFVRPDRVPQMADAQKLVNDFKPHSGIQYAALYLNQKGFELAQQSKNIKNDEIFIIHGADTSHEGSKGTNNGDKAG